MNLFYSCPFLFLLFVLFLCPFFNLIFRVFRCIYYRLRIWGHFIFCSPFYTFYTSIYLSIASSFYFFRFLVYHWDQYLLDSLCGIYIYFIFQRFPFGLVFINVTFHTIIYFINFIICGLRYIFPH